MTKCGLQKLLTVAIQVLSFLSDTTHRMSAASYPEICYSINNLKHFTCQIHLVSIHCYQSMQGVGWRGLVELNPLLNFQPLCILQLQPPEGQLSPLSPSFWSQVVFCNKNAQNHAFFTPSVERGHPFHTPPISWPLATWPLLFSVNSHSGSMNPLTKDNIFENSLNAGI